MKTKELKKLIKSILKSPRYKPMKFKELCYLVDLHTKKDKQMLAHLLDELIMKGKLVCDKNGRYTLSEKTTLITGILQGHVKGFGFVIPEDTLFEQDIFIASSNLNGALDQDLVSITLLNPDHPGKRPEGRVASILKRGRSQIVGRYQQCKNFGFVLPDSDRLCKDIFIPDRYRNNALNGDKVVVQITVWPDNHRKPEGRILEILGKVGSPGVDILSIFKEHAVPTVFPPHVLQAADDLSNSIPESIYHARQNLTDKTIFTIDGDSAKDFDDAVSLEMTARGTYLLGVHIADVSYYVKPGSPIDAEAVERATSIYAINQVIPMLPFRLSDDLCSLCPGVDRLALSCEMEIESDGSVVNYTLFKSIIHSKARMTYSDVNKLLDSSNAFESKALSRLRPFSDTLRLMQTLASLLYTKRRLPRGTIDFDFSEAQITVNKMGIPQSVDLVERGVSEHIIEEFMLLANETVAKHLENAHAVTLFRNHPEPDAKKLSAFQTFISRYGFSLGEPDRPITGKDFQHLQHEIKDSNEASVITLLMLRTMQQAVYSGDCIGHYALAAPYYTHFTSPIRRYPDLVVHRTLSELLNGKKVETSPKVLSQQQTDIQVLARHCSEQERKAEKIERDIQKMKLAEYMTAFIGKTFEGKINGVTSFGFFVELPNTVEGLVRLQTIRDDYYAYDEELHQHIGERFGRVFRLGQPVTVRLVSANPELRQIDFELLD